MITKYMQECCAKEAAENAPKAHTLLNIMYENNHSICFDNQGIIKNKKNHLVPTKSSNEVDTTSQQQQQHIYYKLSLFNKPNWSYNAEEMSELNKECHSL